MISSVLENQVSGQSSPVISSVLATKVSDLSNPVISSTRLQTAGKKAKGGEICRFNICRINKLSSDYTNHRFYTPRKEKDNVVNPAARELLLKEL